MKALIVFGSTSDAPIYEELQKNLTEANIDYQFDVISAHRQPDKLVGTLRDSEYDCVIAGAGLAAHLPGVAASHISKPVIGIPVASQLNGLDALLSILQMPAGIPVHTAFVDQTSSVVAYLRQIEQTRPTQIHLFECSELRGDSEWEKQRGRAEALCSHVGMNLTIGPKLHAKAFNIVPTIHDESIGYEELNQLSEMTALRLPWVAPAQIQNTSAMMNIYQKMRQGGLWVGVNNIRNSVCGALQWMLPAEQISDLFIQVRKGEWP